MQSPSVYIDQLHLIRPDTTLKAALCGCVLTSVPEHESLIQYLHPRERTYCSRLRFKKRITSYVVGRFVAKNAVAALSGQQDLTNILIQHGIFSQPIVVSGGQNIQVSITHSEEFGAALAFPEEHPLGIDIEKIKSHTSEVLDNEMTPAERECIRSWPLSRETCLTLLWTAKEALSKILKTGLTTPFEILEIPKFELYDNYIVSYYRNFKQYKAVSFTIGSYAWSVAHPVKTQLHFDIRRLKLALNPVKRMKTAKQVP